MAGDIFFTEDQAWSSNTNGFVYIIRRVMDRCRLNGEDSLANKLGNAEELRSLGLNLMKNRDEQLVLTKRILEAAGDELTRLRGAPGSPAGEQKSIEDLFTLARKHLERLTANATHSG